MRSIGILGGAFDPVHNGHLRLALEILERARLESISLIPVHQPPHRPPPVASAEQRLAMLEAAIQGLHSLQVDDRELRREGVSYTVDTLISLREDHSDFSISLILGMDAFRHLHQWSQWERLLRLAHIIVAQRPGADPPTERSIAELTRRHKIEEPIQLHQEPAGYIWMHTPPMLDISSTSIRESIAKGNNVRYLLPGDVLNLITENRLYHAS